METALVLVVIYFIWLLVGCAVCGCIDAKVDGRLMKYIKNAPIPFAWILIVTIWPLILLCWWKYKDKQIEEGKF